MCSALRSFLKFLFLKGHVLIDVSGAVPSVAQSKLKMALPKYFSPQQIRKILSQCDRSNSLGKRDYAILLLLARLGLRANEVSILELGDIDWQSGCISIRIKGGGRTQMPLPSAVGKA
jgi:integrase/recombinase XerD